MAAKTKSVSKKNKGKNKGDTFTMAEPAYPRRTSVDIVEADNGFIVSTYGPKGEKKYVAKDKKEAVAKASELFKNS